MDKDEFIEELTKNPKILEDLVVHGLAISKALTFRSDQLAWAASASIGAALLQYDFPRYIEMVMWEEEVYKRVIKTEGDFWFSIEDLDYLYDLLEITRNAAFAEIDKVGITSLMGTIFDDV